MWIVSLSGRLCLQNSTKSRKVYSSTRTTYAKDSVLRGSILSHEVTEWQITYPPEGESAALGSIGGPCGQRRAGGRATGRAVTDLGVGSLPQWARVTPRAVLGRRELYAP